MWQQQVKYHRFSALLVILLALLAGPPILLGFGMSAMWFDSLMAAVLVAAVASHCFDRQQRLFALVLGVPTIVLLMGSHTLSVTLYPWFNFLAHVGAVLFFFGSSLVIVVSLFKTRPLTLDSLLGAICGYLLLGLSWAVLFSMIETVYPDSFKLGSAFTSSEQTTRPHSDELIYYSFVTLTTVGYGDIVPLTAATRTCAWLEAVSGQFYLAVIVAGLVSILVAHNRSPDREGR